MTIIGLLLDPLYVGIWVYLRYYWCDCVDVCWWRRLKWMWFDFSLKLSTQSIRLNSSLRSFIRFSEMKKKLQSLHWGGRGAEEADDEGESWRRWTGHISALSHTIKDTEEMMKASDVCFWRSDFRSLIDWLMIDWVVMINGVLFCRSFQSQWKVSDLLVSLVSLLLIQIHCSSDPECSSRVQISSQPDPQTPSGALIHVPRYLGNLPFRVWKKMQDIVQNSESDCRRSELAYTHTGNDAWGCRIFTDFSIMCEEPHDLLHQNQQLTFRNKEFHNSMCLTFIVSVMKDTEVISAVFN